EGNGVLEKAIHARRIRKSARGAGWVTLARDDQLDALLAAEVARILLAGRVVPVLVHAEAGQHAALVGIVHRPGRGLGGPRRFVQVVVRIAPDLGRTRLAP